MLELKNITKKFNKIPVINQVNFNVKPGEIVGYLGPNGAGKSTTIKILAGLMEPTQGSLYLHGQQVDNHAIDYKKKIGYIPEHGEMYGHLSGQEYLQLVGRLRQIPDDILNKKIDGLMDQFGLSVDKLLPIANYSKGMSQKVLISAALLHDPEILLLDEPLSGLDVSTILVLKELLKKLAEQGKMIIYSSHMIEVVERICHRIIIINKGKILVNDSVSKLSELMQLPSLELIFKELLQQKDTKEMADSLYTIINSG